MPRLHHDISPALRSSERDLATRTLPARAADIVTEKGSSSTLHTRASADVDLVKQS